MYRLTISSSTETELSSGDAASVVGQSLTTRLDTIKEQYREELEPLTAQREALQREIAELRETREQCLEESTALTAKNEELAELNAQLTRQNESLQDSVARGRAPTIFSKRTHPSGSPSMSSLATSGTLHEVPEETARVVKVNKPEPIEAAPARRFKWGIKSSKGPDMSGGSASISKPLNLPTGAGGGAGGRSNQRPSTEFGLREHSFQQYSTMRLTRCELCQEKMWGLQEVRCSCKSCTLPTLSSNPDIDGGTRRTVTDSCSMWYDLSLQMRRKASPIVYRSEERPYHPRRSPSWSLDVW